MLFTPQRSSCLRHTGHAVLVETQSEQALCTTAKAECAAEGRKYRTLVARSAAFPRASFAPMRLLIVFVCILAVFWFPFSESWIPPRPFLRPSILPSHPSDCPHSTDHERQTARTKGCFRWCRLRLQSTLQPKSQRSAGRGRASSPTALAYPGRCRCRSGVCQQSALHLATARR
jgi:hypothetical protein